MRNCDLNDPQFNILRKNFQYRFFSVVYYPPDTQVKKGSSALAHWEHGEIKTLVPSKICWIHGKSVKIDEITKELRRNVTLEKFQRKSVAILLQFCCNCKYANCIFICRLHFHSPIPLWEIHRIY